MIPGPMLRRALADATTVPSSVEGIANLYGSNAELAAQIAGTSDKRDPAYRAAIRNIQRYRQGTRGTKANTPFRQRIIKAALPKALNNTIDEIESLGATVTLAGWVRISDDRRFRTIGPQYVPPRLLRNDEGDFFSAAKRRRWGDAASAFTEGFFLAYGMGAGVDVDEIETLRVVVG